MSEFYRDYEHPIIARLARKAVEYRQQDPFEMVPETGRAGAELIPAWWKYQGAAATFIAMMMEWERIKTEEQQP
jgi:hypothetical protein